eukprot:tig00021281_g19930.t1
MCVAPLDVVKISMQLNPDKDRCFVSTSKRIYRGGGIVSFWTGNLAAEYLWASYAAVQFVVYSELKTTVDRMLPADSRFKPAEALVCGALAGAVATAATYPLDLVRTRLARQAGDLQRLQSSAARPTFRRVFEEVRREGPWMRGFFRGLAPALGQIVPSVALHFSIYESMRAALEAAGGERSRALDSSFAGAVAGATAKAVTYPFDLVKRRMQVEWSSAAVPGAAGGGGTVASRMLAIVRAEGPRGLFRGLTPALAKSALATGLTFCVHDAVSTLLVSWDDPAAAGRDELQGTSTSTARGR